MAVKRQVILDRLATNLKTITVGGGYYTNIGSNVYEWRLDEYTQSEIPAVDYADVRSELVIDSATNRVGGVNVIDLAVEINIHVNDTSTTSTAVSSLRRAIEDVKRCLRNDLTMNGNVMSITLAGDQVDVVNMDYVYAFATLTVIFRYYTDNLSEE